MDDSSLQQSEIVMLLIEAIMHDGARVPIYFNQAYNSEKSVRPLQLVFQKETTQTNIDEGERMKKVMNELRNDPYFPTKFPNLQVNFRGYLTMIDGKVTFEVYLHFLQLFVYIFTSGRKLSDRKQSYNQMSYLSLDSKTI